MDSDREPGLPHRCLARLVTRPRVLYRVLAARARGASPPFLTGRCKGSVKDLTKAFVAAKGFQVGILPREPAIFRIELDRAQQARHRLWKLAAQRKDDGAHVMRVIVERLVSDNFANVSKRLSVLAGIECERGGVKLFLNATWGRLALGSALPIADVEVELNTLVQLLLIGVVREHGAKEVGRLSKLCD